jgi:hypothetical protein
MTPPITTSGFSAVNDDLHNYVRPDMRHRPSQRSHVIQTESGQELAQPGALPIAVLLARLIDLLNLPRPRPES